MREIYNWTGFFWNLLFQQILCLPFFIQSIQEHFGFLLKFYNAQWLGNLKTTLLFDLPIENCKWKWESNSEMANVWFFLFRNNVMDFFIGRSKLYIPLFKLKIAHFRPERHFTTNYKSIFLTTFLEITSCWRDFSINPIWKWISW